MITRGKSKKLGEEPASVQLHPPRISHEVTRAQPQTTLAMVGAQNLRSWHYLQTCFNHHLLACWFFAELIS
jgi:hypothetical protein